MIKAAEYVCDEEDDDLNDNVPDYTDASTDAMFTVLYGARETSVSPDVWIIDSGATKHMSPCEAYLQIIFPFVFVNLCHLEMELSVML